MTMSFPEPPPSYVPAPIPLAPNAVVGLIASTGETHKALSALHLTLISQRQSKHGSNRRMPAVPVQPPTQTLLQALTSFKLTIQLLYRVIQQLRSDSNVYGDHPDLLELEAFIGSVTEAVIVVADVARILGVVVVVANDEPGAESRMMDEETEEGRRRIKSLEKLAKRMKRVDASLSKTLSVLQVDNKKEASRYALRAHELSLEILHSSNSSETASRSPIGGRPSSMATRLQDLQDAFSLVSRIPPLRLSQISPTPRSAPPAYSSPPTQQGYVDPEAPPDYTPRSSAGQGSVTLRAGIYTVFTGLTLADASGEAMDSVPLGIAMGDDVLASTAEYYRTGYCQWLEPRLNEWVKSKSTNKSQALLNILEATRDR